MSNATASNQDFLSGQLLIAMPNMGDPRFEHSVVLIITHDTDHAMGVILNKQLEDVPFRELLEQLDIEPKTSESPPPVFFGGPVQTERGLVLHTLDYQIDSTIVMSDRFGLTASKEVLIDIAGANPVRPAPENFLLLIGHAGWGPGQLEQEIAMNAWAHCDADDGIVFNGAQSDVWNDALAKLGVNSAMFSKEWASARRDDQPLN